MSNPTIDDHIKGKHWTLVNGLRCSAYRRPGSPVFAAQLWFSTGAVDEGVGEEGLAHFSEHMLFKLWSGNSDLHGEMTSLGGEIGALTSHDWTQIYVLAPRESWRGVLELLLRMLSWRSAEESEFEQEKKVVCEELRVSEMNPLRSLTHDLLSTSFGTAAYGRPVAGTNRSVANFTLEQLSQFMSSGYGVERAHLVLAGPGEDSEIVSFLGQLSGLPMHRGESRGRISENSKVNADEWFHVRSGKGAPTLVGIGYRTGPLTGLEKVALDVIRVLIGEGENGLLMKYSRPGERLDGLLAGGTISPFTGLLDSLLTVLLQPQPEMDLHAARELSRLMETGLANVTRSHVKAAYEVILSNRSYDEESLHQWLTRRGEAIAVRSGVSSLDTPADFEALYDAVVALAKRTLNPGRRTVIAHNSQRTVTEWQSVFPQESEQSPDDFALDAVSERPRAPSVPPVHASSGLNFRTLPSGIRLCVEVRPERDVLSAVFMLPEGIGSEPHSGFATVFSSVLSGEGSEGNSIQRVFRGTGGALTGFARLDSLGVQAVTQGPHMNACFDLFLKAISTEEISETSRIQSWDRQAMVHAQTWDTAMDLAAAGFRKLLYGEHHPYARQGMVQGPAETMQSFSLFSEYMNRLLRKSPPIISVAGPMPADIVSEKVEQAFLNRTYDGPARSLVMAHEGKGGFESLSRNGDQAAIYVGGRGLRWADPLYPALEVFCAAMGAFHGPVSRVLREQLGEVYALRADCSGGIHPGAWWIEAACAPAALERVQEAMSPVLEHPAKWLSSALIKQSSTLLWGRYHMMHEQSLTRALSMARAVASDRVPASVEVEASRYLKVSFDDVQRVIEEVVCAEPPAAFTVIG